MFQHTRTPFTQLLEDGQRVRCDLKHADEEWSYADDTVFYLFHSDWEVYKKDPNKKEEAPIQALDAEDIQILQTYGQGAYGRSLKTLEDDLKSIQGRINEKMGVKESDTGLASPNLWDLLNDRFRMGNEHPLLVARCTKIIKCDPLTPEQEAERATRAAGGNDQPPNADEQDKYVINVKQTAKFVVALGDKVSPTDIEEGMRVGYVT